MRETLRNPWLRLAAALVGVVLRSDFYRRGDPAGSAGVSSSPRQANLVLDTGGVASLDSPHRVQDDSD